MKRSHKLFLKVAPAIFVAGTLFGVGISAGMASFKGSAVFRDIPSGHYADEAIGEMYSLGIIKGYDSAHFGPNDPVTRGQVAVLLQRLRNEVKGITSSASSSSSSSSSSSTSSSSSSSISSSSSTSLSALGVRFGASAYNVDKNVATGELTVTVVRTGGTQGGGTVEYAFTDGTAVADQDYTPISGTLTFQGTQTSQTLKLKIKNNTSVSGTRTVNAVLKNPTGSLTLAAPASIVININDPNAPTLSSSTASSVGAASTISLGAAGYGVMENGSAVTVTVVRTGDTSLSQTVSYGTTNGTASSGSDYSATSGTFTFAAGETSKTFTVAINNNSTVDGARNFNVFLSNPTGGSVALGTATALVTINDDESFTAGSGSIKLSSSTYSASAAQGKAVITVNHVGGIGAVSVGYTTSNGTAQAGTDYSFTSGTLSFAAGETSKTVVVPIAQKSISNSLTFTFSLNTAVGAPTSDPGYASVLISN